MSTENSSIRNPRWSRDEIILALDLYFSSGRKMLDDKDERVVKVSQEINSLPSAVGSRRSQLFRNPNGVAMKLANFKFIDPEKEILGLKGGSNLDRLIFNEFYANQELLSRIAEAIRLSLNQDGNEPAGEEVDDEPDADKLEGQVLFRLHRVRERNPDLVKKKKTKVLNRTGRLSCEACGFDFADIYGKLGIGFIECHHNVPLYQLAVSKSTRLTDLSLVCSNCHRMIHRTRPILSTSDFRVIYFGEGVRGR